MNEIEIKDVQNVAKNMIVGSKQHSLFNSVVGNNPSLVSGQSSPEPEQCVNQDMDQEQGDNEISIQKVSVSNNDDGSTTMSSVKKSISVDGVFAGSDSSPSGNHNKHLHGMLKPCNKQFFKKDNNESNSQI